MAEPERPRRRGTLSVRTATTALAVTVVGIALAGTAATLVIVVSRSGEHRTAESARLRARDFVALLESGTDPAELEIHLEEDVFVQIAEPSGRVVAASPFLEGELAVRVRPGERAVVDDPTGREDGDDFLVVAERAATPSETWLVVVGRNLDDVREGTGTLAVTLALAVPALLAVVGLTTWKVVGRALAPVEAMRREVVAITAHELARRVPEVPGDDEIARLARTLNEMLARLEGSQGAQRRLVSDAAHELRNPLAAIRQHAEAALAHPHLTEPATLAGDVLSEERRLEAVADDLLLLARFDEQALAVDLRLVDLDGLVWEEARTAARRSDVTIDTSGIAAARIVGDDRYLRRLVRNLIDNAVRHASARVALTVESAGDEVVVCVDDDGPGIPLDLRAAAFDRFRRLDEDRARDGGGAGLGLAIVAAVAAAHEGAAHLEDSPQGGTRVRVTFPAADA